MKKIINGKRYNTETAEKLGYRHNGLSCRDFGNLEETLYRTKKGNFFLYGEGGGFTWAASCHGDGSRSSGCGIKPLTINEAKAWVERYMDVDEYEKLFKVEEA